MSTTDAFWIDNHNVIELRALTNSITSTVDTAATVTVTIKDAAGTEVTGQSWPLSMPHISAGTYRATLDEDLALTAGHSYTAYIEATGTGSEVGHWEITRTARTRNT